MSRHLAKPAAGAARTLRAVHWSPVLFAAYAIALAPAVGIIAAGAALVIGCAYVVGRRP